MEDNKFRQTTAFQWTCRSKGSPSKQEQEVFLLQTRACDECFTVNHPSNSPHSSMLTGIRHSNINVTRLTFRSGFRELRRHGREASVLTAVMGRRRQQSYSPGRRGSSLMD